MPAPAEEEGDAYGEDAVNGQLPPPQEPDELSTVEILD